MPAPRLPTTDTLSPPPMTTDVFAKLVDESKKWAADNVDVPFTTAAPSVNTSDE